MTLPSAAFAPVGDLLDDRGVIGAEIAEQVVGAERAKK